MGTNNNIFYLSFGGDVFLKKRHGVFSGGPLKNCNYNVLNLEAPLMQGSKLPPSRNKSGPALVQKSDHIAGLFSDLNIKYVVGANNHISDFGNEGLKSTINFLDKRAIRHTGFGKDIKEAGIPIQIGETNVFVLSAGEEEFGVASQRNPGYLSIYGSEILENIGSLKRKGKYVIVCVHGGGEEIPLPPEYIRRRYQELIDGGADIIIGHHPHVPQGYEKYNGKHIFYSLGNFIHDAYKRYWGLIVRLKMNNATSIAIDLFAVNVSPGRVFITQLSEEQKNYLEKINKILKNNKAYLSILQTQSLDMYEGYYKKYIERILVPNKWNIFSKTDDKKSVEDRELLFLNLIRNKSHSEFLERALKLAFSEIEDLRDKKNETEYFNLTNYIKRNFR